MSGQNDIDQKLISPLVRRLVESARQEEFMLDTLMHAVRQGDREKVFAIAAKLTAEAERLAQHPNNSIAPDRIVAKPAS